LPVLVPKSVGFDHGVVVAAPGCRNPLETAIFCLTLVTPTGLEPVFSP
jgi:hypothetical protein